MSQKKVLIIAPHMDDEVLGCAGTISKHKENKDKVWIVFIAYRVYNHRFNKNKNQIEKKHCLKAMSILKYDKAIFLDLSDERLDGCIQDIIIPLEKHIKKIRPDIVYVPFKEDNNQDHRAVFDASRVVLRPAINPFIKAIYMYEIASSTDQSLPLRDNTFLPSYYVDISKYINKKISAFNCYRTERRKYPHPRSEKALKILAQKRGIEIGFTYAEAFMVLRHKWS